MVTSYLIIGTYYLIVSIKKKKFLQIHSTGLIFFGFSGKMTIDDYYSIIIPGSPALYKKVTDCDHWNGNKIGVYVIDVQFAGMISAVRTIYIRTLYYRGSDIIAYKFLRASHYVPGI